MKITNKDRLELLQHANKLKDALGTIQETHDMCLSDVGNLESLLWSLRKVLKFSSVVDKDGNQNYYQDWVLKENKKSWDTFRKNQGEMT